MLALCIRYTISIPSSTFYFIVPRVLHARVPCCVVLFNRSCHLNNRLYIHYVSIGSIIFNFKVLKIFHHQYVSIGLSTFYFIVPRVLHARVPCCVVLFNRSCHLNNRLYIHYVSIGSIIFNFKVLKIFHHQYVSIGSIIF